MKSSRPRAFEYAAEYICDKCLSSSGECLPGDTSCEFWSDMCELEKLFNAADEFADQLELSASTEDKDMRCHDRYLAYLGV